MLQIFAIPGAVLTKSKVAGPRRIRAFHREAKGHECLRFRLILRQLHPRVSKSTTSLRVILDTHQYRGVTKKSIMTQGINRQHASKMTLLRELFQEIGCKLILIHQEDINKIIISQGELVSQDLRTMMMQRGPHQGILSMKGSVYHRVIK